MRILFAGSTGVLGRATLPQLGDHEIVAITRASKNRDLLDELGVKGIVCDVYDYPALLTATQEAQPEIVVNFLTALREESEQANIRIRREGAQNLLRAAEQADASRLVVESVAFPLEGDAGRAVEDLEGSTRGFAGEALILRFGRLWGPGTFHQTAPPPPSIRIDEAGAEAARLITGAPPGAYLVS